MKNNGVVRIVLTSPEKLKKDLARIPDLDEGVRLTARFLSVVTRGMDSVIGGVGYDWKTIYMYIIRPEPERITLVGQKVCVGLFARYDAARRALIIRGMLYLLDEGIPMIYSRTMPKHIVVCGVNSRCYQRQHGRNEQQHDPYVLEEKFIYPGYVIGWYAG